MKEKAPPNKWAYLSVGDVKRGNSLHAKLWSVLFRKVLGVVWSIEIIACKTTLASGHISSNNEVRAPCIDSESSIDLATSISHEVYRLNNCDNCSVL